MVVNRFADASSGEVKSKGQAARLNRVSWMELIKFQSASEVTQYFLVNFKHRRD